MRQPPVHSFGHESPAGFGSGGHVPPVVVSGLSVVVSVLVEVAPVVVLVVEVAPVVVLVVLVLVEVAPVVLAVDAVVDVGSVIVMPLDGEPVPSVVPALVLTDVAPVPSPLVSLGTRPSLQPRRVAAASSSAWGTCVDGIALAGPGITPTIAVNLTSRYARTPWGRRMTLAHELCHLLFDVGEDGRVGIVSNAWADAATERRANAFAVNFLAPEPALRTVLAPGDAEKWRAQDLERAMEHLGVGKTTLTWQLHNLGWIDAAARDYWLEV